jgi:CDP-diacylglycerol---glycerol-3-phosphate 3-phosphatidyltransferase
MPSIYDLKPRFQSLLRPAMHALAGAGISPNMVTVAAILGSALAGWYAATYSLWVMPVWLFVRMALNALDGMMARELNRMSRLGAILNEVGDVVSDAALYFPLVLVTGVAQWPIVAFVFGATLTEFCGVLQQALTGVRRYEGPMGKSDRAFAVGLVALVTLASPAVLTYWPWIFGLLSVLTVVTCWNRLRIRQP